VRIWVHAASTVRARRLDARPDRVEYLPFRAVWARQEEDLARRHATRRRADLRVVRADATGAHLGALPPPSRTSSDPYPA
jgi:hypothetical protein